MNNLQNVVRDRRGQNTIEYLLMLTVVVGVVLISGTALKKYMPNLMHTIEEKIMGVATQ